MSHFTWSHHLMGLVSSGDHMLRAVLCLCQSCRWSLGHYVRWMSIHLCVFLVGGILQTARRRLLAFIGKYNSLHSVLWRCWLGGRKGIRPVKNWVVGCWHGCVWSEVQTCIWPSWCHCHSLSLASVKSRLVLPFWHRLTRIVPEKGLLNGCDIILCVIVVCHCLFV